MPTETTPTKIPPPLAVPTNDNNNSVTAVFDDVFQHDTSIARNDSVGASTIDVPPSSTTTTLDQKPAAVKPPPQSATTIKRVFKSSFNFKSNINSSIASTTTNNSHPCGILHASKTINNTEQHTFGWIANINNLQSTNNATEYLCKYGYNKPSSFKFIPYTSKLSWISKYPQCNITFDVDTNGVVDQADWEAEQLNGQNKNMSSSSKKKKKSPRKSQPKLLPSAILPNKQRTELHKEIYNYFNWLHSELQIMEKTNHSGRRQVTNSGINVLSLKGMIGKMENAFKILQDGKLKEGGKKFDDSVTDMAMNDNDSSGMNVDDIQLPTRQIKQLPYLETALEYELNTRACALSTSSTTTTTTTAQGTKKQSTETKISWRSLNFDTLYQKLVDFKNDKGHVSPPFKHPELGRWVSELRANKKMLREKGLEFEPPLAPSLEGEDGTTTTATADAMGKTQETPPTGEVEQPPPKKKQKRERKATPPTSNCYLSQVRVQQLDSIGFIWSIITNRATWDERFEELKQFKVNNGRFPTTKEGTLGNWLKNQRKLFSKEDVDFMTNKKSKFEEIGCPLRQRTYVALSWDDRFQQLVEYGRVNRHFNVPKEYNDTNRGIDSYSDAAEQNRFHKFVSKLHTEYRAIQRGVPSTMLNEERIAQLRNIGFEFSAKADKSIPEVDWPTRLQHLESFKTEMGHLKIDPIYDKFSNLGGWAVQISERYKRWQEGQEYVSPEMVDKFNHLSAMGFGFDVVRSRRGERSWDDSFNLLIAYQAATGNTRVPHHYKADYRLGSWVAVHRKEYKLLTEGKQSRLTQEHMERLQSVGFEWTVRRGGQQVIGEEEGTLNV